MAVLFSPKKGGAILEVQASGKLTHADYRQFVPEFERLVEEYGRIRILFVMEDFRGWNARALWDDIKLDLKHFHAIERLALAGEKRWQKWMGKFCRPFTSAEIRCFHRSALDRARAWLFEESGADGIERTPILRVSHSRNRTRAYYNRISRFYDLLSDRSEKPIRRMGLDLLNAGEGDRILEIGFGTGRTLTALAEAVGPDGAVHGIDLSDRMTGLARKRLAESALLDRAQLCCGDATRLPYPADTMDAVFMSFTLELFDTPEIPAVLSECKRVLRPGGRIVVAGMSKENGRKRMVRVFEWTHTHFPNLIDCRPIYVREALEHAGFKIRRALKKRMWIPVEIVLATKIPQKATNKDAP